MIRIPPDQQFYLDSKETLIRECERLMADLPLAENPAALLAELRIGGHALVNRLVALAGPSQDADENGWLSTPTRVRYQRWAAGGYGLLRTELFALHCDARTAPRQPFLCASMKGAWRDWLAALHNVGARVGLLLDARLRERAVTSITLRAEVADAIALAKDIGFDGIMLQVDGCGPEGYEPYESLATRLATLDLPAWGVRFCGYEAVPGGFGVDDGQLREMDPAPATEWVKHWAALGARLAEITVNHPALRGDLRQPLVADDFPHEHPLSVLARRLSLCRSIKEAVPEIQLLSEGFSWLRRYFPDVAAGAVQVGTLDLIGCGRIALAYPDAPQHLVNGGALDPSRCCVQCGACRILRQHGSSMRCLIHTDERLGEWCAQLTPPSAYADHPGQDAVLLRQLHQDAARWARENGLIRPALPDRDSGRRIAVVGAGPCGIAATIDLLERGHTVDLYEASDRLGGIPERVIPRDRFQGVQEWLHTLLEPARQAGRLTVYLQSPLQAGQEWQRWRAEYDAVLLATGLWGERSLGQGRGVWTGLTYLEHLKRHGPISPMPHRVALLAGGDAVTDSAVQLRAAGANPLYILYPGVRGAMWWCMDPAWLDQPGVELLTHAQPLGYTLDAAGRVSGVRIQPMGQQGDKAYVLAVDMVVEGQGMMVEPGLRNLLTGLLFTEDGRLAMAESGLFATAWPGVYAAGALINGGASVAACVAEGRGAAREIHQYVQA